MDHSLFLAINGLVGKWPWLDSIGWFIGGDYFLYAFALFIVLLWLRLHWRKRVYLAIFSAAFTYGLVVQFFKHVIARPRPFELLQVQQLIIDNERGNSFPSGHTAIYFSFAFAFWGTKYFWPFLILAILGSVGRVFVGVHYPLDILAGAFVGFVITMLMRQFFKHHFR